EQAGFHDLLVEGRLEVLERERVVGDRDVSAHGARRGRGLRARRRGRGGRLAAAAAGGDHERAEAGGCAASCQLEEALSIDVVADEALDEAGGAAALRVLLGHGSNLRWGEQAPISPANRPLRGGGLAGSP